RSVSRSSKAVTSTWLLAANACAAFVGAPAASNATAAGGPRRSSTRSALRAGKPRAITARRRGVPRRRTSDAGRSAASSRSDSRARSAALPSSTYQLGSSSVPISNRRSATSGPLRGRLDLADAHQVRPGTGFRQPSHPLHVSLPFGLRQHAARIEQVEGVRALQHELVARVEQTLLQEAPGLAFETVEQHALQVGVALLEVVAAVLLLEVTPKVAHGDALRHLDVEAVLDVLQVHRQALHAVGQLDGH